MWGTSCHLELGERGFSRATEKYGMCGLQVGVGGLVSDFHPRSRKGGRWGFPGGAVAKNPPVGGARDVGSIPGWGSSSGEGHDNPLQYSHPENPKDRGAWRATVHGVAKGRMLRKPLSTSPSKGTTDDRATTIQGGGETSFSFLKAWAA